MSDSDSSEGLTQKEMLIRILNASERTTEDLGKVSIAVSGLEATIDSMQDSVGTLRVMGAEQGKDIARHENRLALLESQNHTNLLMATTHASQLGDLTKQVSRLEILLEPVLKRQSVEDAASEEMTRGMRIAAFSALFLFVGSLLVVLLPHLKVG